MLPKFVSEVLQCTTNFGSGALVPSKDLGNVVPIRSCGAMDAKKGRLAPALKHLGIERTLALGPGPFRLRGAGGLRNPSRESRPGPEATVLLVARQIDPRLAEFRLYYDSLDEPVSAYCDTCAMMSHRFAAVAKVFRRALLPRLASGAIISM